MAKVYHLDGSLVEKWYEPSEGLIVSLMNIDETWVRHLVVFVGQK